MALKGKVHQDLDYSLSPMILSKNRLIDVMVRSDEENEFYFDLLDGAVIYISLEAEEDALSALEDCLFSNKNRYIMFPKMTLYEIKKYMELFTSDKISDIEIKERLSDVLLSRNFKQKFPEVLSEYMLEYDRWNKFFFDKLRLVTIEWLCNKKLSFVFEEDLSSILNMNEICMLKETRTNKGVSKNIKALRNKLIVKADTYHSLDVLHPRPKRGRPPKKVAQQNPENPLTPDIYFSLPEPVRPFIYQDAYAWDLQPTPLLMIPDNRNLPDDDIARNIDPEDEIFAADDDEA